MTTRRCLLAVSAIAIALVVSPRAQQGFTLEQVMSAPFPSDLAEALRKQGVPFEQLIFPDDVHDFLLHRRWVESYRAAADFFARMLGR